jgi:hypothetical protein
MVHPSALRIAHRHHAFVQSHTHLVAQILEERYRHRPLHGNSISGSGSSSPERRVPLPGIGRPANVVEVRVKVCNVHVQNCGVLETERKAMSSV